MCVSCFHPAHRGDPSSAHSHHFQVWFWIESKKWGKREPSLTLTANVTGCVLLEAVQRGTGANLISFCLDWQALLRPLSAWVLPLKRVGGKLFNACVCSPTITHQNLHWGRVCLLLTTWKTHSRDFSPFCLPYYKTKPTKQALHQITNKAPDLANYVNYGKQTAFWNVWIKEWKHKAF